MLAKFLQSLPVIVIVWVFFWSVLSAFLEKRGKTRAAYVAGLLGTFGAHALRAAKAEIEASPATSGKDRVAIILDEMQAFGDEAKIDKIGVFAERLRAGLQIKPRTAPVVPPVVTLSILAWLVLALTLGGCCTTEACKVEQRAQEAEITAALLSKCTDAYDSAKIQNDVTKADLMCVPAVLAYETMRAQDPSLADLGPATVQARDEAEARIR